MAKIAEHFGGPTFADEDSDLSRLLSIFLGGEAGHRRQISDPHLEREIKQSFAFLDGIRPVDRAAVERLLVRKIELQSELPLLSSGDAFHGDLKGDVGRLLPAIGTLDFTYRWRSRPEEPRAGDWNG